MAIFFEQALWITLTIGVLISLMLLVQYLGYNLYDFILYACGIVFFFTSMIPTGALLRFILLLLLCLLPIFLYKNRMVSRNPISIGIGLIGFYSMGTSFLSYYPLISLMKGISLILLAGFLLFMVPTLKQLHRHIGVDNYVIRMFLFYSIFIVVLNTLFYFIFPNNSFLAGRYRGLFPNPNTVGALYGIFFLPILWYKIGKHRKLKNKLGLIFIYLIGTVQLLASQSRAGILSAMTATLFMVLGTKKLFTRIIVISVICILILFVYVENVENNFIKNFIYRNEGKLEGSGRLNMWALTWNSFIEKPLFGGGLGVAETDGIKERLTTESFNYNIEKGNSFLAALGELGVVGFLLLAGGLLIPIIKACMSSFSRGNNSEKSAKLIFAAIVVAGLVNAVFEQWLLSVGSALCLFFWIFSSLLLNSVEDFEKG
jgi:O-antigen ligase